MSAGIRSSSTSRRTKSKSVFDADGKPTSISLTPSATSRSNIFCLRAESIGLTSAWLPSRRSVEHQIGRAVDDAVGPGAVGQVDGRVGAVLPVRHGHRLAPPVDGLLPAVRERGTGMSRVASPTGKEEGKRKQAGGARKLRDPEIVTAILLRPATIAGQR